MDIQNKVIADLDTRIVMPLGNASLFANQYMDRLTPEIEFEGDKLILLAAQIASVPKRILKKKQ